MHNLQPNTEYKIVTVNIAVPSSLEGCEIFDGLNEMLNDSLSGDLVVDWSYTSESLKQIPLRSTDADPHEGDLFLA